MTVTPIFAPGQQELIPSWSNYLDEAADVRPYLQLGEAPNRQVDGRLQLIVDFACTWVQNYLGGPVAPVTVSRRFSGWSGFNGAIIPLPYYPILEVKKVIEWWGVSGPHELLEQTPAEQIGAEAFQIDNTRGYLIRTFVGLVQRPWFPGSKNIEVEWVAGYDPVLPDIKIATLELIAHWWRNTQQASRSSSTVAEYDPDVAGGMWQGVPHRVTALLSPYVRIGIG